MEHDFREVPGQDPSQTSIVLECAGCGALVVRPHPANLAEKEYRERVGVYETCEDHVVHDVMET